MEVILLSSTSQAEYLCGQAAMNCRLQNGLIEEGNKNKVTKEKALKVLKEALDSGHESIIEHAVFTFDIEGVSRNLSHQLVRSRLASYSQQSGRSIDSSKLGFVTPETIKKHIFAKIFYEKFMKYSIELYEKLIIYANIPREDARYCLPSGFTTNIVVTMNARELLHFFELRLCNKAQWEIRELATKMLELVKKECPIIFEKAGPPCIRYGKCREKKPCGKQL